MIKMTGAEEVREPITQVMEEEDGVKLIVELPGVSQDSIKMGVAGDILKLDAEGKRGRFRTVQVIPFEPDPERIAVTFSQGVLEVELKKRTERTREDSSQDGKDGELSIPMISLEKEMEELKSELDKVLEEKAALEERIGFLQRDFQNIRRRHENEKESIADRKISEIASGLVDVLDSFSFAKESILSSGCDSKSISSMIKGVEMVEAQVLNLFSRVGISPMVATGQHFDPNFHEAVGYVEEGGLGDEVVAKEIKKGYIYKGKTLRPAQVLVNRRPSGKKRERRSSRSSKRKEKS
ncbi:nucleotide exchange factor GrpE [Thermoplasmatales archaeon ex4484_6]|nr:MAG: nucleotide exchange factor GrpE [Thermoplasmatales archaeon ex4484_6]RLF68642.1 MAG: nucleotide exchange factor GrpE [Thermoplasmata archaeon]